MGQFHNEIPENIMEWIPKQHTFWVASAPLSADGHINISPKGVAGTFHVVNSRRVWYEDLSGTGAETVAHIRENGRVTVLFNAFDGPPRIVRLYGKGSVYEIGTPEYDALLPEDKRQPGSRAVIALDVYKVASTCGYSVPYYQFVGHRMQLNDWAAKREASDRESETSTQVASSSLTPSSVMVAPQDPATYSTKGMKHWWMLHNVTSLDGLPSFNFARRLLLGTSNQTPFVSATGAGKAPATFTTKAHTASPAAQSKHQHRRPLGPLPSGDGDLSLQPFRTDVIQKARQDESYVMAICRLFEAIVGAVFSEHPKSSLTPLGNGVQRIVPLLLAFIFGYLFSQFTSPMPVPPAFSLNRSMVY